MPLIEARLLEGVFSADEREQLAEGLINAVVGVKGENFRTETEILIAEVPVGNWYERGVRIWTHSHACTCAGGRPRTPTSPTRAETADQGTPERGRRSAPPPPASRVSSRFGSAFVAVPPPRPLRTRRPRSPTRPAVPGSTGAGRPRTLPYRVRSRRASSTTCHPRCRPGGWANRR
jgi:4-oxalocrotonate tautomerase